MWTKIVISANILQNTLLVPQYSSKYFLRYIDYRNLCFFRMIKEYCTKLKTLEVNTSSKLPYEDLTNSNRRRRNRCPGAYCVVSLRDIRLNTQV